MRKTWVIRVLSLALGSAALVCPVGVRGENDAPRAGGNIEVSQANDSNGDTTARPEHHHFASTRSVDGAMMLEVAHRRILGLHLSGDAKAKADQLFADAQIDFQSMTAQFDADGTPNDERIERYTDRLRMLRWQVWDLLPKDQRSAVRGVFGPGAFISRAEVPGEVLIANLRSHLKELNLAPDQQQQVDQIVNSTESSLQGIRDIAVGQGKALRREFKITIEDTKEKLQKVLTPVQQEKLGNWLQDRRNTYDLPPSPGEDHPSSTTAPAMKTPTDDAQPAAMLLPPADANPPMQLTSTTTAPVEADVGQPAPEVSLKKLDGLPVQLSSFKGRVIVLEFGSYSCPSFRDRVGAMEQLKKDYGGRIALFVIYTREAFPVGAREVDRNKEDGIKIEQAKDDDARKNRAKQARDTLQITLPILLDGIDDKTAETFHIFPDTPNACFVIGKDGTIVARQKWTDPLALRRHLDEALKPAPASSRPV